MTASHVEVIPHVVSAADVARILGVSRPVAYTVMHAIKPFHIGRRVLAKGENLAAWINAQELAS